MLNTRALLQMVVSGQGCRHEWAKDVYPRQRRIVCNKCGLHAYVPEPRWWEDGLSTLARDSHQVLGSVNY